MVYYDNNDLHTMSFSNNNTNLGASSVMKDNYDHIMKSPAVLELQRKIAELKQENKILIRILRKTICDSSMHHKPRTEVIDLTLPDTRYAPPQDSRSKEDIKCVKIKLEPGLEVSVVEEEKENIQYELVDHTEQQEEEQEEELVEEQEEEEELEEEELEEEELEEEELEEEQEEEEELEEEEEKEQDEAEQDEAEQDEAEQDEDEQEEEEQEEEQEEAEVYEITIKGKKYFTTDEQNGDIYEMDKDGDVGEQVGSFVNGIAKL